MNKIVITRIIDGKEVNETYFVSDDILGMLDVILEKKKLRKNELINKYQKKESKWTFKKLQK